MGHYSLTGYSSFLSGTTKGQYMMIEHVEIYREKIYLTTKQCQVMRALILVLKIRRLIIRSPEILCRREPAKKMMFFKRHVPDLTPTIRYHDLPDCNLPGKPAFITLLRDNILHEKLCVARLWTRLRKKRAPCFAELVPGLSGVNTYFCCSNEQQK